MLNAVIFSQMFGGGLVRVCSLLIAIQLLRSFDISGLVSRLVSFSLIRRRALDVSSELGHELFKSHVLGLLFLSFSAELGSLDLDLVIYVERPAVVPLKIGASELVQYAMFLNLSEEAVSNVADYVL